MGYIEGENASIEYRWAEYRPDRLPALSAQLVPQASRRDRYHRRPRAGDGCAGGNSHNSDRFSHGEDPVKLGLVASLARPEGNLTGVNFFSAELVAKRLELLRELIPGAKRLAVLVVPGGSATESALKDIEAAAARWHWRSRSACRHKRRD